MLEFLGRRSRLAAVVAMFGGLCGCTQLFVRDDWNPHRTWPALEPVYFEVGPETLRKNCQVDQGSAYVLYGCARRDYWIGACLVFTEPHPEAWLLEHERKHCAGWDHSPLARSDATSP